MIKVFHKNGYTGILYGKSSLTITFEKKEVFHTGNTYIKTREELYEFLDKFPEFIKNICGIVIDEENGDI